VYAILRSSAPLTGAATYGSARKQRGGARRPLLGPAPYGAVMISPNGLRACDDASSEGWGPRRSDRELDAGLDLSLTAAPFSGLGAKRPSLPAP
jgi:hypothetical protein